MRGHKAWNRDLDRAGERPMEETQGWRATDRLSEESGREFPMRPITVFEPPLVMFWGVEAGME